MKLSGDFAQETPVRGETGWCMRILSLAYGHIQLCGIRYEESACRATPRAPTCRDGRFRQHKDLIECGKPIVPIRQS